MHDFLVQLQIYKPNLSGREKKLAAYLQAHPDHASQANISELSQLTGVSTATISRFAKALGLHKLFRPYAWRWRRLHQRMIMRFC